MILAIMLITTTEKGGLQYVMNGGILIPNLGNGLYPTDINHLLLLIGEIMIKGTAQIIAVG